MPRPIARLPGTETLHSGRHWLCAGLVSLCSLGAAMAATPASLETLPHTQRFEQAGVEVRLDWTSPQGAGRLTPRTDLELSLELRDAATKLPLSGQRARLWASHVASAVAAAESCPDRTKRLASGRLSARADLELSGFKLLTLNNDRTVGVLDPQVRVGTTRLETLIQLPGDGSDWALLDDLGWVAITLPEQRAIGLIDLQSRKLVTTIATGERGEPRRIVRQPGTARVWVGLDKSDELVAIDLAQRQVVHRLAIGAGYHQLALGRDSGWLFATSSESGEVAVVDLAGAKVAHRAGIGPGALAVAYSTASLRAYVAAVGSGEVAEVDPATGQVARRIPVAAGVHHLRADPSGRYVFGISERAGRVFVIDTSQGRLLGSAPVADQPDQVVFTDRFAYVRSLGSIKVSLINLLSLREGRIDVTEVPMFRAAASTTPQHIHVADMIVPSPEGDGVIAAGTADTVLYSYAEGMMAPQGTFDNARRTPRGLLLMDRGLREVAPGRYQARFRLARPGRYVVPVLVDPVRWLQCVEVVVDGAVPVGETQRIVMSRADPEGPALRPGVPTPLRVKLERENGGGPVTGLTDVQFMVLQMPGLWQQRQRAREVSPGVYEIEQRFPQPGDYQLSVGASSLGLAFGAKGHLRLRVPPVAASGG